MFRLFVWYLLYKKYHYNGEVVENFGTNNEKLTGNVFKSNRLVIVKDDGSEINYGQQFIEQFVDFLYGGAIADNANESIKFIKEKASLSAVFSPIPGKSLKQSIIFFILLGYILHQTT